MASIGRWRSPIHPSQTSFIGCDWYKPYLGSPTACPGKLVISLDLADVLAADFNVDVDLAVVFNGGTKSGVYQSGGSSLSCGSDSYVTVDGSAFVNVRLLVDVWSAFRASAWASSVTIDIYAGVGFSTHTIKTYASREGNWSSVAGDQSKSASVPPRTSACPAVKIATVTVNDDGTFSIA